MGRKQYNSAADRRWQQRYQRVQKRKETDWEYDQEKRERRKNARGYGWQRLNVDRLTNGRVAVICKSEKEVRQIFTAMACRHPECVQLWDSNMCTMVWNYYKPEVALSVLSQVSWGGARKDLGCGEINQYKNDGYEIIDFCELLPVIDLGEVRGSPETVDFLLGI